MTLTRNQNIDNLQFMICHFYFHNLQPPQVIYYYKTNPLTRAFAQKVPFSDEVSGESGVAIFLLVPEPVGGGGGEGARWGCVFKIHTSEITKLTNFKMFSLTE